MEKFKIKVQQYWEWMQTEQGVILCTILFLPLGLFLIFKKNSIKRDVKVACFIIGILYISIFAGLQAKTNYLSQKNNDQYNEIRLLTEKNSQKDKRINALEDESKEFTEYKTKMKPYEALSEADAKAKKIDADAADKVNTAIKSLPELSSLTLNDKTKVEESRKLYNALTDWQKKLVNVSKLDGLEAKIPQLEADKVKQDAINAEKEKKKAEEKAKQDAAAAEAKSSYAEKQKQEQAISSASRESKNALSTAKSYLSYKGFSKTGLYDQLIFERYPAEAAQFAIDNIKTDWNENALKTAKDYLNYSSFSDSGLYDQLIFEGYTAEEAQYAINNIPK